MSTVLTKYPLYWISFVKEYPRQIEWYQNISPFEKSYQVIWVNVNMSRFIILVHDVSLVKCLCNIDTEHKLGNHIACRRQTLTGYYSFRKQSAENILTFLFKTLLPNFNFVHKITFFKMAVAVSLHPAALWVFYRNGLRRERFYVAARLVLCIFFTVYRCEDVVEILNWQSVTEIYFP